MRTQPDSKNPESTIHNDFDALVAFASSEFDRSSRDLKRKNTGKFLPATCSRAKEYGSRNMKDTNSVSTNSDYPSRAKLSKQDSQKEEIGLPSRGSHKSRCDYPSRRDSYLNKQFSSKNHTTVFAESPSSIKRPSDNAHSISTGSPARKKLSPALTARTVLAQASNLEGSHFKVHSSVRSILCTKARSSSSTPVSKISSGSLTRKSSSSENLALSSFQTDKKMDEKCTLAYKVGGAKSRDISGRGAGQRELSKGEQNLSPTPENVSVLIHSSSKGKNSTKEEERKADRLMHHDKGREQHKGSSNSSRTAVHPEGKPPQSILSILQGKTIQDLIHDKRETTVSPPKLQATSTLSLELHTTPNYSKQPSQKAGVKISSDGKSSPLPSAVKRGSLEQSPKSFTEVSPFRKVSPASSSKVSPAPSPLLPPSSSEVYRKISPAHSPSGRSPKYDTHKNVSRKSQDKSSPFQGKTTSESPDGCESSYPRKMQTSIKCCSNQKLSTIDRYVLSHESSLLSGVTKQPVDALLKFSDARKQPFESGTEDFNLQLAEGKSYDKALHVSSVGPESECGLLFPVKTVPVKRGPLTPPGSPTRVTMEVSKIKRGGSRSPSSTGSSTSCSSSRSSSSSSSSRSASTTKCLQSSENKAPLQRRTSYSSISSTTSSDDDEIKEYNKDVGAKSKHPVNELSGTVCHLSYNSTSPLFGPPKEPEKTYQHEKQHRVSSASSTASSSSTNTSRSSSRLADTGDGTVCNDGSDFVSVWPDSKLPSSKIQDFKFVNISTFSGGGVTVCPGLPGGAPILSHTREHFNPINETDHKHFGGGFKFGDRLTDQGHVSLSYNKIARQMTHITSKRASGNCTSSMPDLTKPPPPLTTKPAYVTASQAVPRPGYVSARPPSTITTLSPGYTSRSPNTPATPPTGRSNSAYNSSAGKLIVGKGLGSKRSSLNVLPSSTFASSMHHSGGSTGSSFTNRQHQRSGSGIPHSYVHQQGEFLANRSGTATRHSYSALHPSPKNSVGCSRTPLGGRPHSGPTGPQSLFSTGNGQARGWQPYPLNNAGITRH